MRRATIDMQLSRVASLERWLLCPHDRIDHDDVRYIFEELREVLPTLRSHLEHLQRDPLYDLRPERPTGDKVEACLAEIRRDRPRDESADIDTRGVVSVPISDAIDMLDLALAALEGNAKALYCLAELAGSVLDSALEDA